jgi:hypothetical protein
MLRTSLLLAIVTVVVTAGCKTNDIPAETWTALQHADRYELLSLSPSHPTEMPPDHFHGWRNLGRTKIEDLDTRKKLNAALRAGARENKGMIAMCFLPRHGIHVIQGGKVYDLVICFHCFQAEVFEDGQRSEHFLVSGSPEGLFDSVLSAAGIPLAEKQE